MRDSMEFLARAAILTLILLLFWEVADLRPSNSITLAIEVGGALLVFPLVWLGRTILDRSRTPKQIAWTTTFVHSGVGILLGASIVRAAATHRDWPGPVLPVPSQLGLALVIVTGVAFLLTVANLALKGFGAPFFIALSRKLTTDWMYAWTRNPMVLALMAFLTSLGFWFRSPLFVLWVLALFSPAILFFVKVYEERELEMRFGESYLEYKSRTPALFPRKPRG